MHVLVSRSGPLAGQRFDLGEDEIVLGRENATITLNDEETSRRHATIRIVGGGAIIEDLGSTNGTYVDGRRIDGATQLTGTETIRLGQSTFQLEIEAPPAPADDGATRIAARPEPIADPDRTALRDRPAAPAPPPEPIADPDRTAVRKRPPAPEPIADPDRTALRDRPAASARPPARPAPEPPADPDTTTLRARPRAPEPAPAEDPQPPVLAEHPGFKPRREGPVPAPVPARAAADEPGSSRPRPRNAVAASPAASSRPRSCRSPRSSRRPSRSSLTSPDAEAPAAGTSGIAPRKAGRSGTLRVRWSR